jgi:heme A synthase
VSVFHRYIGYSIPALFALLLLWAIVSLIRNKAPNDWFWNILGVVQVVIGIQVIVGAVMFAAGLRPDPNGPTWLHYVYGGLFPAAVLVAAHRFAKRFEEIPWLVFGVAALINFGLTFRALQTGLGID